MLEKVKRVECYHGVSFDIGGVEVKLPIFIVEHGNADVILGRLWERAVRLVYINEEGELYNIRHADEGTIGSDFLESERRFYRKRNAAPSTSTSRVAISHEQSPAITTTHFNHDAQIIHFDHAPKL